MSDIRQYIESKAIKLLRLKRIPQVKRVASKDQPKGKTDEKSTK